MRKKTEISAAYANFLKDVKENEQYECSKFEISTYYDAKPYLKYCREGSSVIRILDGPLKLIFDCFAS